VNDARPVVGLVVPASDTRLHGSRVTKPLDAPRLGLEVETSGAHPDKRPIRARTSGPGKGHRAESVHLLTIARDAINAALDGLRRVNADMPRHERDRLLIPVVSDAGFAGRSVAEAIERMEAGKL